MGKQTAPLSKLIAVGLVIVLLAVGLAVLLPSLSKARYSAVMKEMDPRGQAASGDFEPARAPDDAPAGGHRREPPAARVQTFDAEIELEPRLSVGTEVPESIYQAAFSTTMTARAGKTEGEHRIAMPLPPQIISLSDLTVTVDDQASEDVTIREGQLIWRGKLGADEASTVKVTYKAVGKGIYTLDKPSATIVDEFKTRVTALNSDIRMLSLSLQPNSVQREAGKTVYTWDYSRLMVGRPIRIDVLGIAGVDRLAELGWLGPVSVVLYGLLVTIVALAIAPAKLNGWMLLLLAGCFAAAYPLMYFMQEFMTVPPAVAICGGIVLLIIAGRSITLFGWKTGLGIGLLLPGGLMTLTVIATLWPTTALQGAILTLEAIITLVIAMTFLPRAQANTVLTREKPEPPTPPTTATVTEQT
jgi:hypothetical protein